MPFNITNFKSALDQFGGPARANLFEVRISSIPNGTNSRLGNRDFSFFCQSVNIPGINLQMADYAPVGGMPRQFPVGLDNTPLNAIFMMDSDNEILSFFHSWMQSVLNYSQSAGSFAEDDGKLPFEIGYKDEYSTNMQIHHYTSDTFEFKYYETRFEKIFPISVGDIELSWESNDSYLTLPVSFAYDRVFYGGERAGSTRGGRGNGFLDMLEGVAGFADVVKQARNSGSKVNGIQDAVNRLTRVRNSFDNMTDKFGGG